LIPRFNGAILSHEWREATWDKFVTGAPRIVTEILEYIKKPAQFIPQPAPGFVIAGIFRIVQLRSIGPVIILEAIIIDQFQRAIIDNVMEPCAVNLFVTLHPVGV
jgi:hypothetical protein